MYHYNLSHSPPLGLKMFPCAGVVLLCRKRELLKATWWAITLSMRRLAAEAVDRDSILKIRKHIYQLKIAHVTNHKNSSLTPEVAKATNMLTKALELSSSRHRMCALSGIEKKQFNVALDVVSLNIPDWTRKINLDTINDPNPEGTDGEGGADGDDDGDEDAPSSPKASSIKDKGKGKANVKKHIPVIAEDEDEDDDMDVNAGPSRAKPRPDDNDVEMNAPDVQTVVPARPKPRPKPVPVNKASKAIAKVAEECLKMLRTNNIHTYPQMAKTLQMVELNLLMVEMTLLLRTYKNEPMKLVTDFELAAGLDAQQNTQRSCQNISSYASKLHSEWLRGRGGACDDENDDTSYSGAISKDDNIIINGDDHSSNQDKYIREVMTEESVASQSSIALTSALDKDMWFMSKGTSAEYTMYSM
ncbi:hypothetical protein P692DRAFT_20822493 [Suillus brevipes Sb2]|nr:hypothetical protein P692DRAFT_20822493 [Suillus brevipes Sb2]